MDRKNQTLDQLYQLIREGTPQQSREAMSEIEKRIESTKQKRGARFTLFLAASILVKYADKQDPRPFEDFIDQILYWCNEIDYEVTIDPKVVLNQLKFEIQNAIEKIENK